MLQYGIQIQIQVQFYYFILKINKILKAPIFPCVK